MSDQNPYNNPSPPGPEQPNHVGQPGPDQAPQPDYGQQPQFEQKPPAAPKKKRNIISILIAVVALGIGAFYLYNNFKEDQALQEGKCVVVKAEGTKVSSIDEVNCDDSTKSSWVIAQSLGSGTAKCSDDYVTSITKTTGRSNRTTATYCLQPNLHVNACYDTSFDMIKCDASSATFKVLKQSAGEDAKCEGEQHPLAFKGAKKTSCVTKVG